MAPEKGSSGMRTWIAILLTLLTALSGWAQGNSTQVDIRLSVEPLRVRYGQSALVRVVLRNPRRDEVITLQATATYQDVAGNEYQVQSAPVTLTVDASLQVRIDLSLPLLSVVPGTATWDGKVVELISNSLVVTLPGDGQEHALEVNVVR